MSISKSCCRRTRWISLLITASIFSFQILAQAQEQSTTDQNPEVLRARLEQYERTKSFLLYAETVQEYGGVLAHQGAVDEAIAVYDHAAALCHDNKLYKWFAVFKRNIAEIDFMMDRRDKALVLLDSLSQLKEIPGEEMAAIYYRLGDLHCDQGNYEIGMPLIERALEIVKEGGYEVLLGGIYTELGLGENFFGSKIKAIDYLIKAIPYLTAPRHSGVLCHNYLILSNLFDDIGQRDKADEYFEKASAIVSDDQYDRLFNRILYKEAIRDLEHHDPAGLEKLERVYQYHVAGDLNLKAASVAMDIAAAYVDFGQSGKAKEYLDIAWHIVSDEQPSTEHVKYYEYLARYHLQQGDTPAARESLRKNQEILDLGGHKLVGRSMALEISLLRAEGRYLEALELTNRRTAYQDSLNSLLQNQILFETEAKYQKEEREKEIALLSARNEIQDLSIQKASRQQLMLILGIIGIGLIAAAALYTYRVKHRLNTQLVEKNTLISTSLSEKELLLKEIHHRVKNNLEVISSLLYLQSKYVEDKNALEAIQEGQNRVRSMSLIHKNLYQEENLTGVEIHTYLEKLVDGLMKSYKIGDGRIDVKKDIAPLNLDVDTAIPLALIINELISNTLKYAFPNDTSGLVLISLHEQNKALVLTVEDNGIGLPADFDVSTGKSLGYKLIDMFTKKLEGSLDIIGTQGTKVVLRISKYQVV